MIKEQERLSFEDEILKNKIKSIILMGVVVVFLLLVGYFISMATNPEFFFLIMIVSIIFSFSYTLISFYNSDKIALASVGAKLVDSRIHEQKMFIHSVESMSLASGLPMPRAYVMQSEQINAFASGRNPKKAVICVTTGALKKLNKQELEGVIAHEMAHIANFDIRFMTLTAVLIGMIAIISEIFLRSLWLSNGGGDSKGKGNAVFMIIGIVLAILAPIAAQIVSLAISRKREYTADATGVKFTRYPPGLKNALIKIKSESVSSQDFKRYNHAVAPLFISNPFKKLSASGLFSTHPPIDERIKRLGRM